MITPEPAELSERLGIVFADDLDDLDYLKFAVVSLPRGGDVMLVRHLRAPDPGTEVYADANADPGIVIDDLRRVLGLAEDSFYWVATRPDPGGF